MLTGVTSVRPEFSIQPTPIRWNAAHACSSYRRIQGYLTCVHGHAKAIGCSQGPKVATINDTTTPLPRRIERNEPLSLNRE